MKKILLIILLCAFSLFYSQFCFSILPQIRVQIPVRNSRVFKLKGIDLWVRGVVVKNDQVKLFCHKNLDVYIYSPSKVVQLNNEFYRGALKIFYNQINKNCMVVNVLPLERYLQSLLSKEMHPNWPINALKAQAIVARSYALHKMERKGLHSRPYDLISGEIHQVSGSLFDETEKTAKAVSETAGLILVDRTNKIVPGFFHSQCGGQTLAPENVWQHAVQGIQSVKCPYCHNQNRSTWEYFGAPQKFLWLLDKLVSAVKPNITIVPTSIYNPYIKVILGPLGKINVRKSRVRQLMGAKRVPSNTFSLTLNKGLQFKLTGKGNGHGVGLCQYGALGMAKNGYNAWQIVKHYFPLLNIQKEY